jgi:hypothetical protein
VKVTSQCPGTGPRRLRPSRLLPILVVAFALLGAASASAITRADILARAQSWMDAQVPYSQTRYFHGYRTDCSGFASMCWKATSRGRPYSLSTRTLHDVSHPITPGELLPGDAMLHAGDHVRIFYGWLDPSHTSYVAYEQTGPSMKTSVKNLASDLAWGYRPYRYDHVTKGLPPWNLVVNPTFDVWVHGSPVWWALQGGGSGSATCTRTTNVTKSGRSALGLVNPSGRQHDVVRASQTASVTPGVPYTLSVWASADADPASLELRLEFTDSAGNTLATRTTTGAAWSLETTALTRMSLAATAPAEAASATISVGLSGGLSATGTVGVTAILDDFRFYDSSPVASTIAVSRTSVARRHTVTVSGRVTAPVVAGTVRIYVRQPGRTSAIALADRVLVNGAWSMNVTPGRRGTYTFAAKYLGYGPYGPVTSAPVPVKVR